MKVKIIALLVLLIFFTLLIGIQQNSVFNAKPNNTENGAKQTSTKDLIKHPLQIEEMRKIVYPGSEIKIERELPPGSGYKQYVSSYNSEGNKIYALLTIPTETKPNGGWPVIVFNHGYIPPEEYRTTERYVAYVEGFAKQGYIVFKPDYRGHGMSEGEPLGTYYSPAYTADVLNAVSSIKKYKDVNFEKIGMWGHSMGGHITVRSMVINKDIKAGVIWGGVVSSYEDMFKNWRRSTPWKPSMQEQRVRKSNRQNLVEKYGEPNQKSEFWRSIAPINFVEDISGPIQLHHGINDEEVPWEFSESLYNELIKLNKGAELYKYESADHNLSQVFNTAMSRSVIFFDKHLK